ncbi:MAG: nucleotidyl transferase AbiEii/AbiGii toxin family protein [Bacteroidales bacterium]|nr:nucleotidyl transferase AbiEii/AbiGii toxin family protein [Bacteroidales bacterium]MBQ6307442.1 nucleotidyl transferase AbiEii/AbiGii toxin family protein [Bacteroidales bacterium]
MAKKKNLSNYGKSVKERLLNISRDEQYSSQLLLSRYFQERLLYRLSVSEYKDRFILKGGALLYAHDGFQARPTLDIDFMARRISNDAENIKGIFSEICQIACAEDGVTFDSDTIETGEIAITKEYRGLRVSLMAHLDTAQQRISMDVGFGDVITPYPQQLAFPALIDTVPGTTILTYSLETVVAEKFQAMISLSIGNSRMKDFFDVYQIMTRQDIDAEILGEAIKATFANRDTKYVENHPLFTEEFFTDTNRNLYWEGFLRRIKFGEALSFVVVGELIRNRLQPYWEGLKP